MVKADFLQSPDWEPQVPAPLQGALQLNFKPFPLQATTTPLSKGWPN